ncbi:MAG TPA: ABC transporter permease [Bryobacteraceae bacterium]|nr:ABC transporter permease [Bryobacteraceae bacterium]
MGFRRFFHRTRADADHVREFQSFLEIETDENLARGMSPQAARRAAHLKFGNPTAFREEVYEMNSIQFIEALSRDVRYALRALKAAPTFTAVSLLTLALGIGATTAIFTVIDHVILQPLPYPAAGRLVTAWETNPTSHLPGKPPGSVGFSPGNYLDLRDQNRSFAQIGAFYTASYNLEGGAAPVRATAGLISAALFRALGVRPAIGRPFTQSDDTAAAERVAIISHSLWRERFSGSAGAIGSAIRLDGQSHTIVGVMPPGFRLFEQDVDVWLPLERKTSPQNLHWRWSYYLTVVARLKDGVSIDQARQDVDRVVQGIRRQYPGDLGQGGLVVPLLDQTIASARKPLWILFGAVAFVLLIACANVAHLSLGRAITRRREMVLRQALGAGRGRLVRQLFTESLMLALGGAAAGVLLAQWGVRALLKLASNEIPRAAEVHLDGWVLGFAALAAVTSAVVFGLLPALAGSKADLQQGLQENGRSGSGGPGARAGRRALVVSEIALALVLMIGAGLMIGSFRRVSAVDPGFAPHGLVTMRVSLSPNQYGSPDKQNDFYQRLIARLRAVPGLRSVSAVDGLPFTNGGFDNSFSIDGRPDPPPGQPLRADIRRIDPGYFAAMGISLLEGRTFSEADRIDAPPVAIISQSMAREYWPQERVLGKRLTIHFGPPEGIGAEIVGVAADVHGALDAAPVDDIYLHYPQGRYVGQMDLVLRPEPHSHMELSTLSSVVRAAVASIDPDQPVYRVHAMDDLLSVSLATRRFEMLLLAVFAALAGCLAAVGLYGVLAYSVQARTREIGIRTALGASHAQVSGMILREALQLAFTGVAGGVLGALALTRLLSNLLYGVRPTDAFTFASVALLLLAVAISAGYLPARKAARINPVIALRHEC